MTIIRDAETIHADLDQMASAIHTQLASRSPMLVGIHTGGVWVAKALQQRLGEDFFQGPLGTLNIAYYRDDFTRIGMHPQVEPSDLPFTVDGQHLLLVDDVVHSGRTTRAALNEIFDYGRPASVTLAVLADRGGRELPIHADILGVQLAVAADQQLKLQVSDAGLVLVLKSAGRPHAE